MLKDQILNLHNRGYKQTTIRRITGASASHISEVISTKKCRKTPQRITNNEFKLIKKLRNER